MHVKDAEQDVQANRQLLEKYLESAGTQYFKNAKSYFTSQNNFKTAKRDIPYLTQVHSSIVMSLEQFEASRDACDGIFSSRKGQALAILTADCLPIVLVSKTTNEFAAVHAGWRGLHDGILDNAIAKFTCAGKSVAAWIGPAICQYHFEVGEEVATKFADFASCIKAGKHNKFHINLSGIAELELNRLGVSDVQQSGVCTYCQKDLFSYRRSSHQGFADCGRMATIVIRY